MSAENTPQQTSFHCPQCSSGSLTLQYLTYYTRLGNEWITVPNFPAWVCDMCHHREDDARARDWLRILLSAETGTHTKPKRPQRRRSHPSSNTKRAHS